LLEKSKGETLGRSNNNESHPHKRMTSHSIQNFNVLGL